MATHQCKGVTKSGKRCGGYAVTHSGFCFTHDPDLVKARAERNRRGGLARAVKKVSGAAVQVSKIEDVLELVNKTILDSWELENTAARSRVLLGAADMAIKAMQIGALEERVAALERTVQESRR